MEQNNPLEPNQSTASPEKSLFDLQVDAETISYLGETAKWAKFIAIVGFVLCGIGVLVGIFAGTIFGTVAFGRMSEGLGSGLGVLISLVYIGFALLYFFPCLYQFRFATRMLAAIRSNDQIQLNASFRNLKSCYKFVGILMIIIIGLYALVFVGAIVGNIIR